MPTLLADDDEEPTEARFRLLEAGARESQPTTRPYGVDGVDIFDPAYRGG